MFMKHLPYAPLTTVLESIVLTGVCLVGILAIRVVEPDDATLRLHGALDVAGHLLTALIAWAGIRTLRIPVPIWSILIGGVVLDLGHVLNWLGYANALDGSSRNGSHSLFIVAILACIGFVDRRRAHIWLGVAMGATSHLWRDMGTGTVALLWPLDETVYGTLFSRYVAVLAGVAIAMIGSAALLGTAARSAESGPHRPR
jgi:membrane-bound metal-dependent hydrolase YbcI (DUF457 family)